MASTVAARCAHLSTALSALEAVAPLALAAKWDNTGLLLDATAPFAPGSGGAPYRVFLTNDLTPAVLDEALQAAPQLIVSYHPPLFSALKRVVLGAGQPSATLLRCARAGVAVYSPHTALDAVAGGMNDWLLRQVFGALGAQPPAAAPIRTADVPPAFAGSGAGDGRLAALAAPVSLAAAIAAVKTALGLERVSVALPAALQAAGRAGRDGVLAAAAGVPVSSIAVCAGSGGAVFSGLPSPHHHPPGLLLVTGEMGHHEVLAATAGGAAVLLTGHSNCERGFLPELRAQLLAAWEAGGGGGGTQLEVLVSAVDSDPLTSV